MTEPIPTNGAPPKKKSDLSKVAGIITRKIVQNVEQQLVSMEERIRTDTATQINRLESKLASSSSATSHGIPLNREVSEAVLLNDQGVRLYYSGDLEEAVNLLTQATQADPDLMEAWNNLAMAQSAMDQHDAAVTSFGKAVALAPDSTEVLNNRAVLSMLSGNHEEALAVLESAKETNPRHIPILLNLAQAYSAQGQYAHAVRLWKTVVAIEPAHEEALRGLRQFYQ